MSPERSISKLSRAERRKLVALGIHAGKSNRAIAKEIGVDEGTIRRDRKALSPSEGREGPQSPSIGPRKPPKKLRKLARPLPVYNPAPEKSQKLDARIVINAIKLWIEEEHMVLEEIEYVLHEAAKRLHFGREVVRSIPASSKSPSELLERARPVNRDKDEIVPGPDFWADWLARFLALCFPRQEELRNEILRKTGVWARSRL